MICMEFSQSISKSTWNVSDYTDKSVTINGIYYDKSLIVFPKYIAQNWPVRHIENLTHEHLQQALSEPTDSLFIGTGPVGKIPCDTILQPLYDAHIGFEAMSTLAAIRLLMILESEQRACTFCLIF